MSLWSFMLYFKRLNIKWKFKECWFIYKVVLLKVGLTVFKQRVLGILYIYITRVRYITLTKYLKLIFRRYYDLKYNDSDVISDSITVFKERRKSTNNVLIPQHINNLQRIPSFVRLICLNTGKYFFKHAIIGIPACHS